MKTAIFVAMLVAGCAATPTSKQCGGFDTDSVRADLKAPFRTDREWHETLIEMLAWQLDCERRAARADFREGN